MALYTSYYANQLALHKGLKQETHTNTEGERTLQKSVGKRTVDYSAPYLLWQENRALHRSPRDATILPPYPASSLHILPPRAYTHCPASSFAVMFAAQAPSKTRTSVNVIKYTPDGRRCIAGTQAGEFTLWDGSNFNFESIIQGHESPVRAMTFTHHGKFFVTADEGGAVHYRSTKTGLELIKVFVGHQEPIRGIAFAPSDVKFVTGSDDSSLRIWDFARASAEAVLAGHGGDVRCVDWHPTTSLLVSGSKDTLVKLWDPRNKGRPVGTLHGHKATLMNTLFNQTNGNWVLTASRDQTCKVFDVRFQKKELASFKGHDSDVTTTAWHPIHEDLFVSGYNDGTLCYWVVGRAAPQAKVEGAHDGTVWTAAWHPTGHLLATGAVDASLKFWCRARPGDPFMEQQRQAQREKEQMEEDDAAAAAGAVGGGGAMGGAARSSIAAATTKASDLAAAVGALAGRGRGGATTTTTTTTTVFPGIGAIPGIGVAAPVVPVEMYNGDTRDRTINTTRRGGGGGGDRGRELERGGLGRGGDGGSGKESRENRESRVTEGRDSRERGGRDGDDRYDDDREQGGGNRRSKRRRWD